jgi:hypothetical protein
MGPDGGGLDGAKRWAPWRGGGWGHTEGAEQGQTVGGTRREGGFRDLTGGRTGGQMEGVDGGRMDGEAIHTKQH